MGQFGRHASRQEVPDVDEPVLRPAQDALVAVVQDGVNPDVAGVRVTTKLLKELPGGLMVQALFLCAPFFQKEYILFTFSQTHSPTLTFATRRHKYSRGLRGLWSVPGILVSFFKLQFALDFGGKMPL